TARIANLVRLQYKLLWAKTRSRNGRIALFLAGYILLILLVMLLATGGFSGALLALRRGRGEQVAQFALLPGFAEALIATTILGFGMNAIFSESELRRYPLTAADRLAARHLIGIIDPFWFLFLALELGLAVGLYAAGVGFFWLGLAAVLLLFVCNYAAARVLALLIDRVLQRKAGSLLLFLLVMVLAIGPSLLAPAIKSHPEIGPAILRVLRFSPPFGAAAAMVRADAGAAF